jgi:hypothetical protein
MIRTSTQITTICQFTEGNLTKPYSEKKRHNDKIKIFVKLKNKKGLTEDHKAYNSAGKTASLTGMEASNHLNRGNQGVTQTMDGLQRQLHSRDFPDFVA